MNQPYAAAIDVALGLRSTPRRQGMGRALCRAAKPDRIQWCDGSREEYDRLCDEMVKSRNAEAAQLGASSNSFSRFPIRTTWRAPKTGPSSARRKRKTAVRPTNWVDPAEMRATLDKLFDGCMRGAYSVCGSVLDGAARLAYRAYRHRTDRLALRRGEHAHHDSHVGKGYGILGKSGHFVPCVHSVGAPLAPARRMRAGRAARSTNISFTIRRPRKYGLRLRLRRQCAAWEEVLFATHRLHHGPGAGYGSPSTCYASA